MRFQRIGRSPDGICVSRREGMRWVVATLAILAGTVDRSAFAQTPVVRAFALDIRQRRVAKALQTLRVTEGERVVVHWTTDEAVEIHLHGYDIELKLTPGPPKSMEFEATVTGRFPISGHGFGHRSVAYLEVLPR